MNEEQPILFALPRFTRWMKILAIYVGVMWLAAVIVQSLAPSLFVTALAWLALIPMRVVAKLELWRVLSYVLLEDPRGSGMFSTVFTLWMFGAPVERALGPRGVAAVLVAGAVGGALAAIAVGMLSVQVAYEPIIGLYPAANALLIAWGFLNADERVRPFGLGDFSGKQVTLAFAAITVGFALLQRSAGGVASVGGLAGGALYMFARSRIGGGRGTGGKGTARKRRESGPRFRVVPGGRKDGDKKMWN